MSIEVMTRVWKHSKAKGSELLALLAIADFADDDGFAWPSYATLAKKSRVSRRQIIRVVENLQAGGEIKILERRTASGDRDSNGYRVITLDVTGGDDLTPPRNDDPDTTVVPWASPPVVSPVSPKPSLGTIIEPGTSSRARSSRRAVVFPPPVGTAPWPRLEAPPTAALVGGRSPTIPGPLPVAGAAPEPAEVAQPVSPPKERKESRQSRVIDLIRAAGFPYEPVPADMAAIKHANSISPDKIAAAYVEAAIRAARGEGIWNQTLSIQAAIRNINALLASTKPKVERYDYDPATAPVEITEHGMNNNASIAAAMRRSEKYRRQLTGGPT